MKDYTIASEKGHLSINLSPKNSWTMEMMEIVHEDTTASENNTILFLSFPPFSRTFTKLLTPVFWDCIRPVTWKKGIATFLRHMAVSKDGIPQQKKYSQASGRN